MEVLKYPHPVLKMVCKPLRRVDAELRALIQDEMFPLMYATRGVGLSANQVGLPYRFFIMNPTGDAAKPEEERVFLNPELTLGSGKPVLGEEGCLSFPNIYAEVLRAPKATIRGFNLRGEEVVLKLDGFSARIVQHEFDHLNGLAFIDRLDEEELDAVSNDLVRQTREVGEITGYEAEIERLLALRC